MARFERPVIRLGAALATCALAGCSATGQSVGRVVAVDGTACSSTAAPPVGMTVVTLAELPPAAISTLKLIAAGGPYPYDEDGTVFGNYQRLLPREPDDYYHEFTVAAAGERSRGPRRVVTGSGGQDYYTPDHYTSFDWISCGSQTSR
ncbi:ribonuclease domain-containing protein [Actinospica robiniae]|uniref:ribonuclease domain-containing protein n=1 Tax=Actinospica robiniae TaxID=304901 RepID=UPI0009FCC298|nr:ribonuclease domain-containing protein [Actinospica robiniae]